jgi:3-methyladenine DNA glycosylase Tag
MTGEIQATIQNARASLELQAQDRDFDAFVWRIVDGQPVQNA